METHVLLCKEASSCPWLRELGIQTTWKSRGDFSMRNHKGFSLIELLIVVAIILIIAAIAVPSLLRSRLLANESAAASTIRTISTAQATYQSTFQSYSANIPDLVGQKTCPTPPPSLQPCLVHPLLHASTNQCYTFTTTGVNADAAGNFQES